MQIRDGAGEPRGHLLAKIDGLVVEHAGQIDTHGGGRRVGAGQDHGGIVLVARQGRAVEVDADLVRARADVGDRDRAEVLGCVGTGVVDAARTIGGAHIDIDGAEREGAGIVNEINTIAGRIGDGGGAGDVECAGHCVQGYACAIAGGLSWNAAEDSGVDARHRRQIDARVYGIQDNRRPAIGVDRARAGAEAEGRAERRGIGLQARAIDVEDIERADVQIAACIQEGQAVARHPLGSARALANLEGASRNLLISAGSRVAVEGHTVE